MEIKTLFDMLHFHAIHTTPKFIQKSVGSIQDSLRKGSVIKDFHIIQLKKCSAIFHFKA
jgi:hypothetical protein